MRYLEFPKLRSLMSIVLARPADIVLELSNACNARCVWCWMYLSERKSSGFMSWDGFRRFIDLNVADFRRTPLTPYHRGEPLLHPRFFDMVDYAIEQGWILGDIHTNLGIETIDVERLASLPFQRIVVNIGGTEQSAHEKSCRTSWTVVERNLRHLLKAAAITSVPILVKMNVTKDNVHQVHELRDFVTAIGGRPQSARLGSIGFPLPNLASDQEKTDFLERVHAKDVEPYLRFDVGYEGGAAKIRPRRVWLCRFLMPVIRYDGTVSVCCHDQLEMLSLAQAFEQPLTDILRSSLYRRAALKGFFRGHSMCQGCN